VKREIFALVLLCAVFVSPPVFAEAHGLFSGINRNARVAHETPAILMYHDVMDIQPETDAMRQIIGIRPEHLEEQFKYLEDNGYTTLFVTEFVGMMGGEIPKKSVVITFDDGLTDVYDTVLPLIQKYHIKITVYANPGFNGTNGRMNYAQIRKLYDSGLVEIGAHTMNHANLTLADDDEARAEIRYSKEILQEIIEAPVTSFAYPFGKFGYREEKMVADEGFRIALAADSSHGRSYENLLSLPRTNVGEKTSLRAFIRILRGL
jgi:peptidoglycan/xylan/chitin deacetylase (PgdA/CDA1 family)